MKYKSQSGFTLLELLLVIGVAALLLIGGIATYRMVSEGNKATQTTRLLLTIKNEGALIANAQGGSYTGVAFNSTAGASDAAGGQSPFVLKNILRTAERNAFNGPITIGVGAQDHEISVQFENISKPACQRLMVAIMDPAEVVSVGTATATYTSAASQFPITALQTAAACDQLTNTITWVFR